MNINPTNLNAAMTRTPMSPDRPIKRPRLNNRSRGQVMVIFVAAILTFVGLCAIVVDVSWYWANTLRVQRAADAAALAGAVYLPDDPSHGLRGGPEGGRPQRLHNGVNGVKVTPFVDPTIRVSSTSGSRAPVKSFFAQRSASTDWTVSRASARASTSSPSRWAARTPITASATSSRT